MHKINQNKKTSDVGISVFDKIHRSDIDQIFIVLDVLSRTFQKWKGV